MAKSRAPQEKLPGREDLHNWQMEKVKASKMGSGSYIHWMVSWREGGKTRNIH